MKCSDMTFFGPCRNTAIYGMTVCRDHVTIEAFSVAHNQETINDITEALLHQALARIESLEEASRER